ncbi:unnamed protein product [Cyprideis torosa]|uniref:Uncharacterized protein n=1 Tax=Cyprideis torosa TaxID=163714 RepID=A0A7R8WIG6_9CRUS|nr:unnamed protein product [Cyprideis torosa]CAG0900728.1 unnamed protein product [Cyprideis torosa]
MWRSDGRPTTEALPDPTDDSPLAASVLLRASGSAVAAPDNSCLWVVVLSFWVSETETRGAGFPVHTGTGLGRALKQPLVGDRQGGGRWHSSAGVAVYVSGHGARHQRQSPDVRQTASNHVTIELDDTTARSIVNGPITILGEWGFTLDFLKANLVAVTTDGASVMVGNVNGVLQRLKDMISRRRSQSRAGLR